MPTIKNKTTFIAKAALSVMALVPFLIVISLLTHSNSPPSALQVPTADTPTLTEFGDFRCPHCANFAFTVMPTIQKDFIDRGILNFEYRHYPFLSKESTLETGPESPGWVGGFGQ